MTMLKTARTAGRCPLCRRIAATLLAAGLLSFGAGYVHAAYDTPVTAALMPALTGDCTSTAGTVATTCTKTGGTAFGTAATANTGTSGSVVPLLNGNNSYSGVSSYSGSIVLPMRTITVAGSVTASATTDYFICINKSTPAATIVNLPSSPATGLTFVIKDCGGVAAANNNTITPLSGNIDGAATYVQNVNHQSTTVSYDGTQWEVN